jgi:hypothetical protein
MSNGHKLEIRHNRESVELIYWDWLHGQDRIYTIHPDGTCYEMIDESETPIDLPQELLKLNTWLESRE